MGVDLLLATSSASGGFTTLGTSLSFVASGFGLTINERSTNRDRDGHSKEHIILNMSCSVLRQCLSIKIENTTKGTSIHDVEVSS